jgi:hypothetical protein
MECSHRLNKSNAFHDKVDIDLCHSSNNMLYQDVPLHGLNSASRSVTEFKHWTLIRHGVRHLEGLFLDQGFIEMGSRICYIFAWPLSSWEDCEWLNISTSKVNEDLQIVDNECYKFKVLGKEKELTIKKYKYRQNTTKFILLYHFWTTCFDFLESSSGPLVNWSKTI